MQYRIIEKGKIDVVGKTLMVTTRDGDFKQVPEF